MHTSRFPGETPAYRAARDELLAAERDLRSQVERVAAARRRLPLGAPIADYVFEEADGETSAREVRLSQLFDAGKDTLVLYSYMFGPDAAKPCPMCTCFLDALDGNAPHLRQRVSLAVAVKSPVQSAAAVARERGWRNLRVVSSAPGSFNRDFHAEDADGSQGSIIHVFVQREGAVHHFYSSELQILPAEAGQNQRHIDLMWPLWNVLDLTPEGRGKDWFPKLSYG